MTVPGPASGHRVANEAARERSLGEVSDVLLNLDHTLARAKKAKAQLAKDPDAHNAALAISDLIRELETARKRLVHDTYYADDAALRLL